jgi:hypothetical protein
MTRLLLVLRNEVKLARTAVPIHIVAMLQPTLMYLVMSLILVHPTFDMYVTQPDNPMGRALVAAMEQVGSPIGEPYINPILVEDDAPEGLRQIVTVVDEDGRFKAVQEYGLIDSNIVKNFRNRLTAAALLLWNQDLGDRAITVEEQPWLLRDMPYTLYFGMAMLPLSVSLAASMVGGILTAQDFESGAILEYRLSPVPTALVVGTRLLRLVVTGLVAALIFLVVLGLVNGVWPDSPWVVVMTLIPVGVIAGCVGITGGLLFRKGIPAFLVALVASFVSWLVGSAFGLAAGFSRGYEFVSRLTPNTHAVELLYPSYFGAEVGRSAVSVVYLAVASAFMIALTLFVYRLRVLRRT